MKIEVKVVFRPKEGTAATYLANKVRYPGHEAPYLFIECANGMDVLIPTDVIFGVEVTPSPASV